MEHLASQPLVLAKIMPMVLKNKVYATSSEASNKGGYYKAGDWTEDATNANVNNKDIITLVQGAIPEAAPQNAADKWLFQGTYYLPERYIAMPLSSLPSKLMAL